MRYTRNRSGFFQTSYRARYFRNMKVSNYQDCFYTLTATNLTLSPFETTKAASPVTFHLLQDTAPVLMGPLLLRAPRCGMLGHHLGIQVGSVPTKTAGAGGQNQAGSFKIPKHHRCSASRKVLPVCVWHHERCCQYDNPKNPQSRQPSQEDYKDPRFGSRVRFTVKNLPGECLLETRRLAGPLGCSVDLASPLGITVGLFL